MLSDTRSTEYEVPCAVRHAAAWVGLCLAFAIHVADEALTDFLSFYNPAVRSIRDRVPWLPLPAFSFEVWLGGLIIAVIVLSSLTVLILRGARGTKSLSYVFGLLMLANGLFHIAGSLQIGRLLPGTYSAPLLLIASLFLIVTVHRQPGRIQS